MGIKQVTPMGDIEAYIAECIKRQNMAIIHNLRYIGETCINMARNGRTYHDITGNLRSSIGYIIMIDGRVDTMSAFEVIKNGAKGASDGKKFIKELMRKFPKGVILIVAAGMEYATYVEAKGLDVLTSSQLWAEQEAEHILLKLGFVKR